MLCCGVGEDRFDEHAFSVMSSWVRFTDGDAVRFKDGDEFREFRLESVFCFTFLRFGLSSTDKFRPLWEGFPSVSKQIKIQTIRGRKTFNMYIDWNKQYRIFQDELQILGSHYSKDAQLVLPEQSGLFYYPGQLLNYLLLVNHTFNSQSEWNIKLLCKLQNWSWIKIQKEDEFYHHQKLVYHSNQRYPYAMTNWLDFDYDHIWRILKSINRNRIVATIINIRKFAIWQYHLQGNNWCRPPLTDQRHHNRHHNLRKNKQNWRYI